MGGETRLKGKSSGSEKKSREPILEAFIIGNGVSLVGKGGSVRNGRLGGMGKSRLHFGSVVSPGGVKMGMERGFRKRESFSEEPFFGENCFPLLSLE